MDEPKGQRRESVINKSEFLMGIRFFGGSMLYRKTKEFDNFICTADKCPETCCAGWQIMIDDDSLEYYGSVEGEFGKRLRNEIDWREGCFCQKGDRCAFLNENNLCDLYTALGEDALCETCTRYPRHVEEFDGVREWSLSLSCPVAAHQILTESDKATIVVYDTEEEEDIDEFESFDTLMFGQLEDARELCFSILQDRDLDIQSRMEILMAFAYELQMCIEEERFGDLWDVIEKFENIDRNSREDFAPYFVWDTEEKRALFEIVDSLEHMRADWEDTLCKMYETLYEEPATAPEMIVSEADAEIMSEQILFFFIFTYFCGAVYDDMIYSKMALAVYSTAFIRELWRAASGLTTDEMVRLAYRYAREIEHSDQNLNQLEEIFMERLT